MATETSVENTEAEPQEDPKRWLALAIIAVAQLMVVLDSSIVNIALPSMQDALNISEADRQWAVTAYILTFGGLLLLGGRIADYTGRRKTFLIGLIGFAAASALGGLANSLEVLLASRALQGAFAALMAPAALSIITVSFTKPVERAKAFGVYGAVAGSGAAIGLLMGGVLTEYASWRWCFLVNVPIALAAAMFAAMVVKESKAEGNATYDVPGAITVTAGLTSLVYGFTLASTDGWGDIKTVSFLVGSVVLLAAFVVIQMRSRNPLLPLRIILDRDRGGAYLGSLLAVGGMIGNFLLMTFYFQGTLGYSALKSGFAFLPFSVGIMISATVSGRLLPRLGARPLVVTGFTMSALGLAWLTQVGAETNYFVHILPAQMLMSLGMGTAFIALSNTALTGVDNHDAGVASAALNATQQVGGALGTALLNTIAATAAANYITARTASPEVVADAQMHGYTVGFTAASIAVALAAVVSFFLLRSGKKTSAEPAPQVEPALVA